MLLVISNATLYVFLYGFAGEGGTRNAIYLGCRALLAFMPFHLLSKPCFTLLK